MARPRESFSGAGVSSYSAVLRPSRFPIGTLPRPPFLRSALGGGWPALTSQIIGDAAAGPSLLGVSTTLTLTPPDDRGREILVQLEAGTTPFRWSDRTGARSYWINAQGAPPDGYEAALDRLAPAGAIT